MSYVLFLDDERLPVEEDSVVVRSFEEACDYVNLFGTPTHVDFDHDLGGFYTGMDFARWLVERALNGEGFVDTYAVHSQNPIGKANIEGFINNYLNYHIKETN